MDIDSNTEKKISDLQFLEHSMQGFIMQKQTIQIELNETNNAIDEVKKSKGDLYKLIGNILLKSDRENLLKELEEKKNLLDLRIKSIEKQEKILNEKIEKSKKEIDEIINKNKK
ncbi:MAG: prefoldin subunit beta [Candidatus Pacearchaeota archaeon]|nr:prefoldin subunit beta [Candidatus Pacearchaeota archaeon]